MVPTFAEYSKTWHAVQAHRPGTTEQIESTFSKWVLPYLGDFRLDRITPTVLSGFDRHLQQSLAAEDRGAAGRWSPGPPRGGDRRPSRSDARHRRRRVLGRHDRARRGVDDSRAGARSSDAVSDRYRIGVLLQAMCGLRQGELCGLTVDRTPTRHSASTANSSRPTQERRTSARRSRPPLTGRCPSRSRHGPRCSNTSSRSHPPMGGCCRPRRASR